MEQYGYVVPYVPQARQLEDVMIKLRTVSFLLAMLIAVCVMLPAFAAGNDDVVVDDASKEIVEETVTEVEPEIEEPEVEVHVPFTPFYLNGVNLADLIFEHVDGINYVTVESFVAAVAPEAVVEESDGTVVVSAVSLRDVVVDENGETASIEQDTLDFSAVAGAFYVCANGRYLYLENGVAVIGDKVALPIDVLAKIFNLDVTYNKLAVWMTEEETGDAYIEAGDEYYDSTLLYWLSRIIYSESGNQSMEGKIAVGNVVMNRLNSPDFPNTIKGVLFQKNQFSPAMSGSIYRNPGESSIVAAKLVLDGAEVLEGVLFFNRAGMNTFASRNRTFVATIGAHSFYA